MENVFVSFSNKIEAKSNALKVAKKYKFYPRIYLFEQQRRYKFAVSQAIAKEFNFKGE